MCSSDLCIDMVETQIRYMEHDEAVICRGYAHWLFVSTSDVFHILNLNIETGYVSLTKLLGPTKGGWPLRACLTGPLNRRHPVFFRRDTRCGQNGPDSMPRIRHGPYRPNTGPVKSPPRPLQIQGKAASGGPTPHSQP